MRWCALSVLLAAASAIAGCNTLPGEQEAVTAFTESQRNSAEAARSSGDLARATTLWRSLLLLDATRADAAQALGDLNRQIAQQVSAELQAGERAYRRGDRRAGDQHMLAVLALQPGQPQALDRLGDGALRRARAQARARASEAYSQRIEPASAPETSRLQALSSLAASGDHAGLVAMATHSEPTLVPAERALLRNAHIALADAAEESGDLETALAEIQAAMIALPQPTDPLVEKTFELRSDLSQAAYREGARLLQRDLDGAIKALETALRYNPYNGDARRKLDQANTLQRNLRKIEGLR